MVDVQPLFLSSRQVRVMLGDERAPMSKPRFLREVRAGRLRALRQPGAGTALKFTPAEVERYVSEEMIRTYVPTAAPGPVMSRKERRAAAFAR